MRTTSVVSCWRQCWPPWWRRLGVQVLVVSVELGPDLLLGDQWPDRVPGLVDDLFFEVEAAEGGPAHGVGLAQDGLPVGLADSEGADVHQVRGRAGSSCDASVQCRADDAGQQDRLQFSLKRTLAGRRRRIMSALPGRPDLDQLRRQARELLRAAAASDEEALRLIRAVSENGRHCPPPSSPSHGSTAFRAGRSCWGRGPPPPGRHRTGRRHRGGRRHCGRSFEDLFGVMSLPRPCPGYRIRRRSPGRRCASGPPACWSRVPARM